MRQTVKHSPHRRLKQKRLEKAIHVSKSKDSGKNGDRDTRDFSEECEHISVLFPLNCENYGQGVGPGLAITNVST
jgi:hypothetical protein